MSKLIKNWLQVTLNIKRLFKTCVFFRLTLYESLINKWNRGEYEILQGISPKTRKKRKNIMIESLQDQIKGEGSLRIPNDIKLYYIKRYIQTRMNKYINDYRVYKAHFKSIHRQNKKNRFILGNKNILDYPYPPEKPNLFEEFSTEKMEELIKVAMKDIDNWPAISQGNYSTQPLKKKVTGRGFF